jgi:hypothetical protein
MNFDEKFIRYLNKFMNIYLDKILSNLGYSNCFKNIAKRILAHI